MLSAWQADRLPELPQLVPRTAPRSVEGATFPEQQVANYDLLVAGETVHDLIQSSGWYAGWLTGAAFLTNLKSVAWQMPVGLRIRLSFAELPLVLVVLEGAWSFHTSQVLYTDGCFLVDSKYENEHHGYLPDISDYPAKGTPDRAEREHEWVRRHAKPLSER